MGGQINYIWQANDTIWTVCGNLSFFSTSGYVTVADFVLAVQDFNYYIVDWHAVPTQTRIVLPLLVGA